MDYSKKALRMHKKSKGKIEIKSKVPLSSKEDLSIVYTPGVGAVCQAINKQPALSWQLTNRANSVAIVSDGTAILGLGDIGPEAGMPVMEGKAAIFKKFAGVDAYPLCIKAKDTEEIINFCKNIEPSFGGINLEDISAPRCFDILAIFEKELRIPVFHDDQDGTAIVTLAALINACRVTNRVMPELSVVINGAGAAGIAITRLLQKQKIKNIVVLDSKGMIYQGRKGLNKYKKEIALSTNKKKKKGGLDVALKGADVFIGVSKAGVLTASMIANMNPEPIIFAMANPQPEIFPKEAIAAGAGIVGTGRSDFPNQINNAMVFPGLFRGLLDNKIRKVTPKIKSAVAVALAYLIKKPTKNKLMPNISDKRIVPAIVRAVKASK